MAIIIALYIGEFLLPQVIIILTLTCVKDVYRYRYSYVMLGFNRVSSIRTLAVLNVKDSNKNVL